MHVCMQYMVHNSRSRRRRRHCLDLLNQSHFLLGCHPQEEVEMDTQQLMQSSFTQK